MPETPTWRNLLGVWADGFGVVGGIVLVVSVITFLAGFLSWPIPLVPFTFGVTLVTLFILGKVFISNSEVHQTLGRLSNPESSIKGNDIHSPETVPNSPIPTPRNTLLRHGNTWPMPEDLKELLEEVFELKELRPNLSVSLIDPEKVDAHRDDGGVIVIGPAETAEKTFSAYVISISNTAEHKVGRARKVRASVTFHDYCRNDALKIHSCAWLSEKETEIDLPPNVPPRRLILITIEGNDVFAISRDFSTSYTGPLAIPQRLDKELYRLTVSLFTGNETTATKTLEYILEIKSVAGNRNVVLSSAYYWKLDHLVEFLSEGFEFLRLLHFTGLDADEKATRIFEQGDRSLQRFFADIRVEEKRQEAQIIDQIKDWESRAAAFIALHFGFNEKERFVLSTPSIDDGFERRTKPTIEMSEAYSLTSNEPENESRLSTYWTLSDSIDVRVKELWELSKGLPS